MSDPKIDVVESVKGPNSDIESSRMVTLFKTLLKNIPLHEQQEIVRQHNETIDYIVNIESSLDEIISLVPANSSNNTTSIIEEEDLDEVEEDAL